MDNRMFNQVNDFVNTNVNLRLVATPEEVRIVARGLLDQLTSETLRKIARTYFRAYDIKIESERELAFVIYVNKDII